MAASELPFSTGRRRTISRQAIEQAQAHAAADGQPSRRRQSRLRVRLPATLETRAESHQAILADLSTTGARVLSDARLPAGCEVVLAWAGYEAFGEVIWCQHNQCGIAFVETIRQDTVFATRAINDASQLPDDRALLKKIAAQWVQGSRRL
ncbi:PilZ domain-containing protein [Novosphingobium sp. 1949]|uniref:PilZ domain-containing protein n=1 Tax=Novosphingobium organovorum TaxID=2930092 RepID=A0ABT0B9L8_9SPHN|nr:PilZ domain-containing protein [Novosphingobium organovorum]MCJ2181761.1 PilZ domain-containing protein [Novosphingobium organovorum]